MRREFIRLAYNWQVRNWDRVERMIRSIEAWARTHGPLQADEQAVYDEMLRARAARQPGQEQ